MIINFEPSAVPLTRHIVQSVDFLLEIRFLASSRSSDTNGPVVWFFVSHEILNLGHPAIDHQVPIARRSTN